jgi:hypothetical protein
MSYADQRAAIGNSNYALLKAKVVSWGEIVTKYRVRTLREVIALNKVSLKTAIKAGVPKRAYVAWADANSPAAEVVRAERKRLIESIKGAGVSQEALVDTLSRGLTSRVRLVAPGVDQSMAPFVARRPDLLAAELAALAAAHAALLAAKRVSPEAAVREINDMETVGTRGKPNPDGHYIRSSEFLVQAGEEEIERLSLLTRNRSVQDWAKIGRLQTVNIDSLAASQPTLRKSTVIDNILDPKLPAQELPPPVVFVIDGALVIEDGHHRLAALKALSQKTAKVIIVTPP